MFENFKTSKIMKSNFLLGLVLLFYGSNAIAQNSLFKSYRVSMVNEAIVVPFTQFLSLPLHPGISIGADLATFNKTKWHKSLSVEAIYYYHRLYENALILNGSFRVGYDFRFKLHPYLITSVGYKHSLLTGLTYKFEDGHYVEKKYTGHSQINTQIGIGISYPVTKNLDACIEYLGALAIPYEPKMGKLFATHSLLKVGVKFYINQDSSK